MPPREEQGTKLNDPVAQNRDQRTVASTFAGIAIEPMHHDQHQRGQECESHRSRTEDLLCMGAQRIGHDTS